MQRVKVSYGEFDTREGATSRTRVQNAFLSVVAELAPEVWTELYEATKQTYSALKAEYPEEYLSRDIDNFGLPPILPERTSPVYAHYPCLADLIDLIEGWANRWNLVSSDPNDPWVVKVALAHLEFWNTRGRAGEYLARGFGGLWPIPTTLNPPPGLLPYQPLLQTRARYLGIVRENASKAIDDHPLLRRIDASRKEESISSIVASAQSYCDETEAQFEADGYMRGSEKRELMQHLEWAVRVRVKREKQTRIAVQAQLDDRGITPQAVSKAVKQLLALIHLK